MHNQQAISGRPEPIVALRPELVRTTKPDLSVELSFQFCEDVACREARNFYWSFRLLPRRNRLAMCALYAYMRQSDDIADAPGTLESKTERLAVWRKAVVSRLGGDTANPADDWPGFPAFVRTVHDCRIPAEYLLAVIDGMQMDLCSVRLQTDVEFDSYCWHVASAVGLCCLHIWGFESDGGRAEKLAERLGLAFQRTNILRDVAEDYALDRVYLPTTWLLKHGVRVQELGLPTASENLRRLVQEQVAVAKSDYESVHELLPLVNKSCRPMLRAITRIYKSILDRIESQNYDVLVERARVPKWRKIWIMVRSIYA